MIARNHIEPEELALYAMSLLPDAETDTIHAHLVECAGCSDEAANIRGDLASLALTAEIHTPPSSARQRLMTQVAREKKVIPMVRPVHDEAANPLTGRLLLTNDALPEPSSGTRILPWVSWIGWAVAAGLTVTATDLYRDRDVLRSELARQSSQMSTLSADAEKGRTVLSALTDRNAMRVTLTQAPTKAAPVGRTSYIPAKGSLIFTASNMEPLQPYKTYELWLIPANGHDPIPAGTFVPDARGNASVILPDLPKGIEAKAFGITIEDQGGSLQPTLPIVMSGT